MWFGSFFLKCSNVDWFKNVWANFVYVYEIYATDRLGKNHYMRYGVKKLHPMVVYEIILREIIVLEKKFKHN